MLIDIAATDARFCPGGFLTDIWERPSSVFAWLSRMPSRVGNRCGQVQVEKTVAGSPYGGAGLSTASPLFPPARGEEVAVAAKSPAGRAGSRRGRV